MNITIGNDRTQTYQPTQVKQKEKTSADTGVSSADAELQNSISLTASTDRVEISAQGRAALAQIAVVSSDSAQSTEAESQAQEQAAQLLRTVESAQTQNAALTPKISAENGGEEVSIEDTAAQATAKMDASGKQAALAMTKETEDASSGLSVNTEDSETSTDEAVIESSESSSTNLTSLTEQQIQDLVDAGTISQTEATSELTRREAQRLAQESAEATTSPQQEDSATTTPEATVVAAATAQQE